MKRAREQALRERRELKAQKKQARAEERRSQENGPAPVDEPVEEE